MKLHPLLPALFLSAACTTAPLHPIPDPLPETLEWATESRPSSDARPFLGLKTRENDTGSLDELLFEPGVRVTRVIESSPAAEAGFQSGDILLRFGEHAVDDPAALDALVKSTDPTTPIPLQIQRGDTVFSVPVTLTTSATPPPPPEVLFRKDPSRSLAGWATGYRGVVLVSSSSDAPFPTAGIPVGSTVTSIDGVAVFSARSLIRRLEIYPPGETVEVAVRNPDDTQARHTVELYDPPSKVTGFMIPILTNYGADVEGESTSFVLIDLYIISLFRYTRNGAEKEYRFLRWFQFSSGVGELSE